MIRHHCVPLEPVLTDSEPVLHALRGIRAVLFDLYGTLFISASGDVGTAAAAQREEAFREAFHGVGVQLRAPGAGAGPGEEGNVAEHFFASIHDAHRRARQRGIEHPEVDIVAIWGDTLERLERAGLVVEIPPRVDLAALAVEYEMRTNPTWPMPGASECIRKLHGRGLLVGIISNAQFFTRHLFPALLGKTAEALGFSSDLQFYSYQWGWAKPGLFLYQRAKETLAQTDVPAHNVLYVGNDMLNDIAAAAAVGFHTALFAGDARSLRLRRGDPKVAGIEPEIVVTQLSQLDRCIA